MKSIAEKEVELFPSDFDLYLFHEGTLLEAYNMLGAHVMSYKGEDGVRFSVWAPHAKSVSVVGDFNKWEGSEHALEMIPNSGVWIGFIPGLRVGDIYKYEIITANGEKS